MAKNKKPRKHYRPKPIAYGYPKEVLDKTKAIWLRVEYAVYQKLPIGAAEKDDLLCLRDMLNVVNVSMWTRNDLDHDFRMTVQDLVSAAGEANADILIRGDKEEHFVATGDELKKIMDAATTCGPYIQESIDLCPRTFYREWVTMKELTKSAHALAEKQSIPPSKIRAIYNRV